MRLYDLTREPACPCAVLTFEGNASGVAGPNERITTCSDVAFTPDGRVVAVGMQKIRIWDVASGAVARRLRTERRLRRRPHRNLARRQVAGHHVTVQFRPQHRRHRPAMNVLPPANTQRAHLLGLFVAEWSPNGRPRSLAPTMSAED